MGFQPYDNRMYKFKRDNNIRIVYDYMLEIENLEHITKKYQIGYFPTTVKQLVSKTELSISQIRTAIEKLIEFEIIVQTQTGNLIQKLPSIFYFVEMINRKGNRKGNRNTKSQGKIKIKLLHINALTPCQINTIATQNRKGNRKDYRNLIKEGLKDNLKKTILKEKGIEKRENILTFREELEFFSNGQFKTDECYFDSMNEMEKSKS